MWEVKFYYSTLCSPKEELQVYRYRFKSHKPGHKQSSIHLSRSRKPENTCKHTIQLDESVRFLGLKCPTLPMVCDAHSPNPANINSRVCIMSRLACSITPQAGSPPAPFNATLSMLGSRILAT